MCVFFSTWKQSQALMPAFSFFRAINGWRLRVQLGWNCPVEWWPGPRQYSLRAWFLSQKGNACQLKQQNRMASARLCELIYSLILKVFISWHFKLCLEFRIYIFLILGKYKFSWFLVTLSRNLLGVSKTKWLFSFYFLVFVFFSV